MLRTIRQTFFAATLTLLSAAAPGVDLGDAELAALVSVKGVIVSADNRIALINNRLVRAGEHVDAVEVLAIESGLVHMRVAKQTFAMRVGSALIRESHYAEQSAQERPHTFAATPEPGPTLAATTASAAASTSIPATRTATQLLGAPLAATLIDDGAATRSHWQVSTGETLSEIAAALANDGQAHPALMAALYEHNPEAFGDSMDMLYAGARLTIPGESPGPNPGAAANTLAANAESTAGLEHLERPRATPRHSSRAQVRPGDTLSQIAASFVSDSITLNQVMLAIYAANRDSFGGNINLLYAFELLEIPDPAQWRRLTPQAAHAEVDRHAAVWRSAGDPATSIQHISHNIVP